MLKKFILSLFICTVLFLQTPVQASETFFEVQGVDTMKYSRDRAREALKDPGFDKEIEAEIKNIKAVGATHVAISTPYDDEFIPILTRWVSIARKYQLKVWFRGNFSGWENWFDYDKIDRATHKEYTARFIKQNQQLFADGDIFVSCPECENGGPGDPRMTGDVAGFRKFLIEEYELCSAGFRPFNKNVACNYFSMNGDVAKLVMDKDTTKKLGGIVTIDHYVKTPAQVVKDSQAYAQNSGGVIVLGEFGAPIPDIHGDMTEDEQAKWVDELLNRAVKSSVIIGLNYWTGKDSSTNLWNDDNTPRKVVSTLQKYYIPHVVRGVVTDDDGKPLSNVRVYTIYRETFTKNGEYSIPILGDEKISFSKSGFKTSRYQPKTDNQSNVTNVNVTQQRKNLLDQIMDYLTSLFSDKIHSPIPN